MNESPNLPEDDDAWDEIPAPSLWQRCLYPVHALIDFLVGTTTRFPVESLRARDLEDDDALDEIPAPSLWQRCLYPVHALIDFLVGAMPRFPVEHLRTRDLEDDDAWDEIPEPPFGQRCLCAAHALIDSLFGATPQFPVEHPRTRDLEDDDDALDEAPEPSFGQWCLWAVHVLIDLLVGAATLFPSEWLRTRNWSMLLCGMPALLILITAVGLYVQGATTSREATIATYRQDAAVAFWEGDIEAADVCYRRVIRLARDDSAATYGLAVAAERQGRRDRARSLMQRIAPPDEPGNPAAHYWIALEQLNQFGIPREQTAAGVLEHHLTQAMRMDRYRKESQFWLAELYIELGQVEQAISHLESLTAERPELLLKLAQLYRRRGDLENVETTASRAAEYHRSRVDAEPASEGHRILWAWSAMLQGEYADAEEILTTALETSDSPQAREALVAVYLQWFHSTYEKEPKNLVRQLEVLNRALLVDPDEPRVLALLADLATWEWEGAGDAETALQQALVHGGAPVVVHIILGTRALQKGDMDAARMHLEIAHDGKLDVPLVLNNLAWSLAFQEAPELDRALELAFAARELSDHPEIDDTLGTILAKAGRLREAVQRLESALRGLPDRPEIHGKLADLYERLGDEKLAELHRELSEH